MRNSWRSGANATTRPFKVRMTAGASAFRSLVGASDGELTAGQLIDAIADLLEVDAAALRADLLPRVRELVFTGFLRLA